MTRIQIGAVHFIYSPEPYTLEQLAENCFMYWLRWKNSTTFFELFKYDFKGINITSISSNSIDILYYGKKYSFKFHKLDWRRAALMEHFTHSRFEIDFKNPDRTHNL